MSKIKQWTNDYDIPLLDCGHLYQIKDDLAWKVGNEVVCPTCAEIEERVKQARREVLEEVRTTLRTNEPLSDQAIDAMRLIDKLLEDSP